MSPLDARSRAAPMSIAVTSPLLVESSTGPRAPRTVMSPLRAVRTWGPVRFSLVRSPLELRSRRVSPGGASMSSRTWARGNSTPDMRSQKPIRTSERGG